MTARWNMKLIGDLNDRDLLSAERDWGNAVTRYTDAKPAGIWAPKLAEAQEAVTEIADEKARRGL